MAKTLLNAREIQLKSSTGKTLLQPITVALRAGDRVALTGRSGSGKSLLSRCLACLNPGQTGELTFLGESVSANIPRFRGRCMYVPQVTSLEGQEIEPSTVSELLRAPFELQTHQQKSFDEARIFRWLSKLKRDEDFCEQSIATLSGGEQQIVALLRALQLDPHILLLDEPTSALDEATSRAVETLVLQWQSEAIQERAFVWTSHDSQQSRRIGTSFWHMQDGKLAAQSLPNEADT